MSISHPAVQLLFSHVNMSEHNSTESPTVQSAYMYIPKNKKWFVINNIYNLYDSKCHWFNQRPWGCGF
jgi:hypothetical protein